MLVSTKREPTVKYSNGKLTVYISPALKEHALPGERLIYHVLYTGMVERVRNVTWMSFLCVLLFFCHFLVAYRSISICCIIIQ